MSGIPNRRLIHSTADFASDVQTKQLMLPRNTLSISVIRGTLGSQIRFSVIRYAVFLRIL